MKSTLKLVIVGALFGIIPIALGIVALTTPLWLSLNTANRTLSSYGLFNCKNITDVCTIPSKAAIPQGLLIAGVAAVGAGIIIALLLEVVFKNPTIQLIRLIFLFAGPTLIFIGLLFYAKYTFEAISGGANTLGLEYSIILMIVACIVGYLTAIYFAFVAGLGFSTNHSRDQVIRLNAPYGYQQRVERF